MFLSFSLNFPLYRDFYRGDEEEAERLSRELTELEERADELSKRAQSSTLSSISFINERNRKRNVERAEEAILEEIRASGGKKAEDPFTRRNTKPTMIHRPNKDGPPQLTIAPLAQEMKPRDSVAQVNSEPSALKASLPKPKTSDLFSAHDFDIKIDLEVPLPSKSI